MEDCRRWVQIVFWVLLLAVTGSPFSEANDQNQQLGNFFLPAPRPLRQHLSRARAALNEERYGDAVLELGALLTQDLTGERSTEPQDFFLVEASANGARTSLKSEAQRLLGSMPAKGRDLYELQFGADARALLDEAVADADFEKLNEVVRKYFHTSAGYEAMVLLGRLHMDRGQPLAAALCFQRVVNSSVAARQYDPELSVLLAACWLYADRLTKAVDTIEKLRQRFPAEELQIGATRSVRLPIGADSLDWLAHHFGSVRAATTKSTSQWMVHRGNSARNALSKGGLPLSSFRWRVPTATDPTDAELIHEIQAGYRSQNIGALPSVQPLAVNDVVLMRTPDRLHAIDFNTGKRVWKYPWWDTNYPTINRGRRGSARSQEFEQRKRELVQRLWRDAPYGQIASDGDSVYLLDDLRFAPINSTEPQWIPRRRGGRQPNPNWQQPHNQLVALDLHRQGSLKWIVGGESGMNEPRLARAFFLGPPLPLMGQLYVMAEMNGEIRLLVLAAETGRLEWSQQLAHVDTYTVLRNQHRRLSGASPSFADGVLVCPTSSGAVVAVDLSTRALLWGYQYEPVMVEYGRFGANAPFPAQQTTGSQWADATATIGNGTVLMTPLESNRLFALDLLTGKPVWPPMVRQGALEGMQFVAGIYDDQAILVGKHRIVALSIADGTPTWKRAIELNENQGEMPSGRGFLSDRYYFLPTTTAHLLKIDLWKGEIAERTSTGQVLGNLISFRNEVIAQGTDFLATHYQIEPLREQVALRLTKTPEDAWALARQGELRIHDGDLRGALDSLRKASELDPDDVAVPSMLVDTLLTALRDDFVAHQTLAVELKQLIERPAQRNEYLRLMATGLHSVGSLDRAAEAYLELADLVVAIPRAGGNAELPNVQVDDSTTARLDRWLSARLESLSRDASSSLREKLTAAINKRWQEAVTASASHQENFLAIYGFHPSALEARIEIAERFAAEDRWLEAELLLSQIAQFHTPVEAVATCSRIGAQLNEQGKYDIAAAFYRALLLRWPDVAGPGQKTGRVLYEEAAGESPLREALRGPAPVPFGRAITSTANGPSDSQYRRVIPIPLGSSVGWGAQRTTVAYDGSGASAVLVRDGHGEMVIRTPLDDGRGYFHLEYGVSSAKLYGNLLVVALADRLVAIDMLQAACGDSEAIRWRDMLAHSVPDASVQRGRGTKGVWERNNPLGPNDPTYYFVKDATEKPVGALGPLSSHGVIALKSRTLVCLDPTTGETLWSRANVGRGFDIFGDDQYLFLLGRTDQVATVLNTRDGSFIGSRSIPDWDHRWSTNGRNILAWEPVHGGQRLYLYDGWTEEELWSETLPAGSRGDLVQDSHIAILQPDGRFFLRSLTADEIEIDTRLEPEDKLANIHVLPSADDYVLVTNREYDGNNAETNITEVAGGMPAPLVDGRVYVIDRTSGMPRWQIPAYVQSYGLPLYQPTELPTLWFVRQISTRKSRRSTSPSDRTSVLCLDKRDGRILLSENEIRTRTTSYDVVAQLTEQTVGMLLPGHTVSIQFTDEPQPPEPPAQTGSAAATKRADGLTLGTVLGGANNLLKRSGLREE